MTRLRFKLIVILFFALVVFAAAGCDEDYRTPEQKLADAPEPEFKPYHREFKLDDGTPCVMVWTPMATSRRAGSSGVSCNWDSQQ